MNAIPLNPYLLAQCLNEYEASPLAPCEDEHIQLWCAQHGVYQPVPEEPRYLTAARKFHQTLDYCKTHGGVFANDLAATEGQAAKVFAKTFGITPRKALRVLNLVYEDVSGGNFRSWAFELRYYQPEERPRWRIATVARCACKGNP